MLEQQFERILKKLKKMENTYDDMIFSPITDVPVSLWETKEHLRKPPKQAARPIQPGESWGGDSMTGWFFGEIVVEEEWADTPLYLRANTGAVETMLFVDGEPRGVYTSKIVINSRGNHHTLRLTAGAPAGQSIQIALEGYCWHKAPGTQPFDKSGDTESASAFVGVTLMRREEDVLDFVFNLRILNQLSECLPDDFRRAQVQNALQDVYRVVPQMPWEREERDWRAAIAKAVSIMKPVIEAKNPQSAPVAGLIGHSHMDTAWLWTIDETIRKCARTYSNALSLMEQYPDYLFFQSSAYHTEMMRREYPSIYEGIKKQVAAGRYEPNGGMWIECDCNITSGEAMIRQFLWGQRWTKEHFNYLSDTFWLPDTFGYSAAIPQIMKGVGIKYFLTTKMSWNDTNKFPYDTFYWRGMDGTQVLTQFNEIHFSPEPRALISKITGYDLPDRRPIRHKRINDSRMLSYGFGDGGGGPSYDMIEMASRVGDIEGVPRTRHMKVSEYMQRLEETARELPVYSGELYLELHRGTLTGKAEIKRLNRKGEFALRDLEFANTIALLKGLEYMDAAPLTETLLVNQFHDILPGTSIAPVNDRCIAELKDMIAKADTGISDVMGVPDDKRIALMNTLSWERTWAYLPKGKKPEGAISQTVSTPDGGELLYVEGIKLPAMSSVAFAAAEADAASDSPFIYDENTLDTPHLRIRFDLNGGIASLVDKASGRELRREGGLPLNSFLFGEDIPLSWDNWDIDEDAIEGLRPTAQLKSRKVVSDGALQIRIRSVYALGDASQIIQDMVFYASTPRIDFETVIDWAETHRLLKAGFDLNILADEARHEIQFGYATRKTYKSNPYEQAMFEVCNHKYTDLAETRFGVAILNDCKYGISVDGTNAALTLLKGGARPDERADRGRHLMTYSLLAHEAFSAQSVIHPAYEINVPVRAVQMDMQSLVSVSAPNVLIESVKVAEDGDGIIFRLYEAEKSGCDCTLDIHFEHGRVWESDMLEESVRELDRGNIRLSFRAFEIKTIKVALRQD